MDVNPICPRCNQVPDARDRIVIGETAWHVRCRTAYNRDREWLTKAEAEAHFA